MGDIVSFIVNNIVVIFLSLLVLHYYFKASDLRYHVELNDEVIKAKDVIIKDQEMLINKQKTLIDGQIASLHQKIEIIKPQDIQLNQQFQKTFPMSLIRRS